MSKITKRTSIAELGAIVCEALGKQGIDAFLSGGACVSIYTNNKYESYDLDFVSLADRSKIKKVMESLGFTQARSRLYEHPDSVYSVEFPGAALKIGEETIREFSRMKLAGGTLKLLTPTDCVKDRLAAFYHWSDRQALDQAVWVSQAHPVNLESIRKWSKREGQNEKFGLYLAMVRMRKGD